jgi:hypothetical protein
MAVETTDVAVSDAEAEAAPAADPMRSAAVPNAVNPRRNRRIVLLHGRRASWQCLVRSVLRHPSVRTA